MLRSALESALYSIQCFPAYPHQHQALPECHLSRACPSPSVVVEDPEYAGPGTVDDEVVLLAGVVVVGNDAKVKGYLQWLDLVVPQIGPCVAP